MTSTDRRTYFVYDENDRLVGQRVTRPGSTTFFTHAIVGERKGPRGWMPAVARFSMSERAAVKALPGFEDEPEWRNCRVLAVSDTKREGAV